MIEQSGQTPMTLEDACSEAGRYGVYCRLLEKRIESSGFPLQEKPGFLEVFSLCFALLATFSTDASLVGEIPTLAWTAFDKRAVKDSCDVLYRFPEFANGKEENRLDMACLYVAFEFALGKKETALSHLPYLFSIKEELGKYVEAGYALSFPAMEVIQEAENDIASRIPENLQEALEKVDIQFQQVRDFIASEDGQNG